MIYPLQSRGRSLAASEPAQCYHRDGKVGPGISQAPVALAFAFCSTEGLDRQGDILRRWGLSWRHSVHDVVQSGLTVGQCSASMGLSLGNDQ